MEPRCVEGRRAAPEEPTKDGAGGGGRGVAPTGPPRLVERLGELRACKAQGLLSDKEHDELRSTELKKFKDYGSRFYPEGAEGGALVSGITSLTQLVPLLKGLVQVLGQSAMAALGPGAPPPWLGPPRHELPHAVSAARSSLQAPRQPAFHPMRRIRYKQPPALHPFASEAAVPATPLGVAEWRGGGSNCLALDQAVAQSGVGLYDELRLRRSASAHEIRAAYRQRCLETHPDKTCGDSTPFLRVNRAFMVLSDKEQRREYDKKLQASGGSDGMSSQNSAWAVQIMEREEESPEKTQLRTARVLHMRLTTRPVREWPELLADATTETLEVMNAWIRGSTPVQQHRGKGWKLPPVSAPCIHLSSHGTRYDVRVQFDTYQLHANSTPDLTLAVDRCVALTRIREIFMEKRPACLTLDDFMCAIQFEPTIHIKVVFKKVLQGKRFASPIMVSLPKALQVHEKLVRVSQGPSALRALENILKQMRMQQDSEKVEIEELDAKIHEHAQRELDERAERSGLGPPVQPSGFICGGAPSFFGLAADTGDRLLLFLQLRTLCRLQIVSRQLHVAIAPRSRQRVAHFVYTADSLETAVVYSHRGRRVTPRNGEAKTRLAGATATRLIRFLAQPEHGPLFRHLDLHQAPVEALQDAELHQAIKHMTRLTRLIYPNIGWTSPRLRAAFLAVIPSGAVKEAVMPVGRS